MQAGYGLTYSAHNQKHKRSPGGEERTKGQKPEAFISVPNLIPTSSVLRASHFTCFGYRIKRKFGVLVFKLQLDYLSYSLIAPLLCNCGLLRGERRVCKDQCVECHKNFQVRRGLNQNAEVSSCFKIPPFCRCPILFYNIPYFSGHFTTVGLFTPVVHHAPELPDPFF